jgi:alanine racemase
MRPSFIQVNLNNLIHNFNQIKSYCHNSKIMAAVKANAYGHGLIECAKILEKNKIDFS